MIALPFTCQREAYLGGVEDDHGNPVPSWADPADVPCFWWAPTSAEPASAPTGGDRVTVDMSLVVASTLAVDHRDVFVVDDRRFEVVGLPKDYDHGPFAFAPNRRVIELRWVG